MHPTKNSIWDFGMWTILTNNHIKSRPIWDLYGFMVCGFIRWKNPFNNYFKRGIHTWYPPATSFQKQAATCLHGFSLYWWQKKSRINKVAMAFSPSTRWSLQAQKKCSKRIEKPEENPERNPTPGSVFKMSRSHRVLHCCFCCLDVDT